MAETLVAPDPSGIGGCIRWGPWLCSVGAGDGGSGLGQVMWGWGWLRVRLGGKSEEEG